ncbi:hypothetical protein PVAND_003631 [Polypedilum vanderplanki]|uniref:Uncharacterized protein n=1 Tax=Polypedilum vanderplanki TaxID=319348 RepID=A0A9J6BUN0_POLVA|nr:hypothetical protein PVAND_003631 [Polypedilum vanderplanki]
MFTNVILLSLLTIIYGINGEDGNRNLREQTAFSFVDVPTQHEDLSFIKTPRAIRTPFRNTEIMTARGFGKRNGENEQDDNGIDNTDYGMLDDKVQRSIFFPYFQEILKLPRMPERESSISAPIRNHRLQLRDGPLKFRLNDGNLRIGRGFGKRSFFVDTSVDENKSNINSYDSMDVLKALSQLKAKDNNKEET